MTSHDSANDKGWIRNIGIRFTPATKSSVCRILVGLKETGIFEPKHLGPNILRLVTLSPFFRAVDYSNTGGP